MYLFNSFSVNTGNSTVIDNDIHVHVQDEFTVYLRSLYASLTPTQTSSNQWPPAYTHEYFRLAMIKEETVKAGQIEDEYVRMTITGKVDDILQKKCPIELGNIFQDSVTKLKRKVVLLEGAPGCGKSTLSVYIACLLYTSPSPRDATLSRMPSSA